MLDLALTSTSCLCLIKTLQLASIYNRMKKPIRSVVSTKQKKVNSFSVYDGGCVTSATEVQGSGVDYGGPKVANAQFFLDKTRKLHRRLHRVHKPPGLYYLL